MSVVHPPLCSRPRCFCQALHEITPVPTKQVSPRRGWIARCDTQNVSWPGVEVSMISRVSLKPHKGQCTHNCVGRGNNTIQCNLCLTLSLQTKGSRCGCYLRTGGGCLVGPKCLRRRWRSHSTRACASATTWASSRAHVPTYRHVPRALRQGAATTDAATTTDARLLRPAATSARPARSS